MAELDDWWTALVEALSTIGQVRPGDPYGLTVGVRCDDGSVREIGLMLTPDEWVELVSIMFGDLAGGLDYVLSTVQDQPVEAGFLVYSTYELLATEAPAVPVDLEELAFRAYAAQFPGGVIPGGRWVANWSGEHD